MWNARENGETRQQGDGVVAVAVDKEKSSHYALKWAVENLFPRSKPLKLVHVVQRLLPLPPSSPGVAGTSDIVNQQERDAQALEVFLPYRCFCTRKKVQFEIVILHDTDVAKALIDYVSLGGVNTLLVGTLSRNIGLSRIFKNSDVSSSVLKWASNFCNVYIISKGKVAAMRPARSPQAIPAVERTQPIYPNVNHNADPDMLYDELSVVENDNSLESSGRISTDSNYLSFYENLESGLKVGSSSDTLNSDNENFESLFSSTKTVNLDTMKGNFPRGEGPSFSLHNLEDMEAVIRRHKLELKEAKELYHTACREAQFSKQKLIESQDQEQRLKEVESENARYKTAIEAAQRWAEQEVEKRVQKAEIKAMMETDERKKVLDALRQSQTVIKYQSLFHIFVVMFLSYLYLFSFK